MLPEPTARLQFRTWRNDDLPLAERLWCDAEVTQHFGGPMTADQVRARVAREQETERRRGFQYWPMELRATGEFAGCAGLRAWGDDATVTEAGINLVRSMWSQRLGEEAFRAVLGYGFEKLALPKIVAGHGMQHINSQRMMERIGLTPTHEAPWGPKRVPVLWYAMTREAWQHQAATA